MAILAVQDIPVGGLTPTLVPADAAGDQAPVGDGTFVQIKNGSAAAVTVTFAIPVTVGGAVTIAPSVAAGGELLIPLAVRNQHEHQGDTIQQGTGDNATWTYSATASVQVAALKTP